MGHLRRSPQVPNLSTRGMCTLLQRQIIPHLFVHLVKIRPTSLCKRKFYLSAVCSNVCGFCRVSIFWISLTRQNSCSPISTTSSGGRFGWPLDRFLDQVMPLLLTQLVALHGQTSL